MSAIASPILITLMMAFMVLGLAVTQQAQMRLSLAAALASVAASERVGTRIEIRAASVTGADLTVSAYNAGGTTIADYAHTDLIVEYESAAGRAIVQLSLTSGALAAGKWRVAGLTPDVLHPGLWNSGETLTIQAMLPSAVVTGTTAALVLGAPNGQTAAFTFAV